ncbi:MAG: PKD domain-containing protein [Patescibacteria group bacterium]
MKKIVLAIVLTLILSPFLVSAVGEIDSVTTVDQAQTAVEPTETTVASVDLLEASINDPASQTAFNVNEEITFRAAATGGRAPYAYVWNFGDGSEGAGQIFRKTYIEAGARTVTLTVTDFSQVTDTASIQIMINSTTTPNLDPDPTSALSASIVEPSADSVFKVNQNITFRAAATGGRAPYAYVWNFGDGSEGAGENFSRAYSSIGSKTVTLTVTDFSHAAKTVSINLTINPVDDGGGNNHNETLTISGIRVTDVTPNSAIVRWATNHAASSRVIYDTVSHPSITGQSAPNFGYPSSTGTIDVDTKVIEHAVTVSGLVPSTTYYFRVLSQ